MSQEQTDRSLTRPRHPTESFAASTREDKVAIAVGTTSVMLLAGFFVLTAVIAGWVADLHGSDIGSLSLLGRVNAYEAWLLPVAVASIALAKFGIAVVLYGIVRRLWTRVEIVKQSLSALMAHGSNH